MNPLEELEPEPPTPKRSEMVSVTCAAATREEGLANAWLLALDWFAACPNVVEIRENGAPKFFPKARANGCRLEMSFMATIDEPPMGVEVDQKTGELTRLELGGIAIDVDKLTSWSDLGDELTAQREGLKPPEPSEEELLHPDLPAPTPPIVTPGVKGKL